MGVPGLGLADPTCGLVHWGTVHTGTAAVGKRSKCRPLSMEEVLLMSEELRLLHIQCEFLRVLITKGTVMPDLDSPELVDFKVCDVPGKRLANYA